LDRDQSEPSENHMKLVNGSSRVQDW
jgi:hypothetical protein